MRFTFGAPLGYPYAPAILTDDNPPPALFRRVQAASPPPTRDGAPWHEGMTVDDKPYDPSQRFGLANVEPDEGASSLDLPEPDTIVLDQMFTMEHEPRTMEFPGSDRDHFISSIRYWTPDKLAGRPETRRVEYAGTYRMNWTQRPTDDWVALSFDAFTPKERDSAELIIPLGDCDELCPTA
ncbi:MAG: hypothetical protein ABW022_27955 [Actinoplanes sp.]